MSKLPVSLQSVVDRLRAEQVAPARDELFQIVLELVEHVASREDLITAREIELEPDRLASRILRDPQLLGFKAVESILGGLKRSDLRRLEQLLLELELAQGRVRQTPKNCRILVDGAILGPVGFMYSRKFREVLATSTLGSVARPADVLSDLIGQVDRLFDEGTPRYLWRLGPEFGTDHNLSMLLRRGDWFIARCLYRARARRMEKGVLRWQELANGIWIGENCDECRYSEPARHLVLRWRERGRQRQALLVTNLTNVPWHEIFRLYNNRSGQTSLELTEVRSSSQLRRQLTASFVILALFTFRNLSTWARPRSEQIRDTVTVTQVEQPEVTLIESPNRPELFDYLNRTLGWLEMMTDGEGLAGLAATPKPGVSYQLELPASAEVPALAAGQVVYADRGPSSQGGGTVVVHHGGGFSTVYGNLGRVADGIAVGARVEAGQAVGWSGAAGEPLRFEANVTARYLEKSFEASVAEILSPQANLFLDAANLLTRYEPDPGAPPTESALFKPDEDPATPSLADADAYRLISPYLGGPIIFTVNAALEEDVVEEELLAEAFDEDILGLPPLAS